MNKCEKCGHLHYRTDPCRVAQKSTAVRVMQSGNVTKSSSREQVQALPVDTNPPKRKRGRPPTGFDKAAYNRSYMVKKRARLKAEREAAK